MSGSNSEQQSAFTKPCSQPCIPYASRLPCKFMSHDGRAHELARSRIIIGFEYNTPAKSQACPRTANLLQHTPNLSFEEKDGVSALAQFSTTRLFSALKKAFRPDGHHPRAASGSQISCVQPCLRAVDGSDGRVLRGEGDSGKEISVLGEGDDDVHPQRDGDTRVGTQILQGRDSNSTRPAT